ncbi:hypothetical protein PIOMA14_I_1392 [Prevotella intermedia]|uniref:Uncharacterized protein n=1 Tax=Prevotella intermedia TaxID=28131 RepID=A0A0S3UK35_PREIN|nr:hypothetical protein PIOMA14_I_1392 [Prevotella intermedia]
MLFLLFKGVSCKLLWYCKHIGFMLHNGRYGRVLSCFQHPRKNVFV